MSRLSKATLELPSFWIQQATVQRRPSISTWTNGIGVKSLWFLPPLESMPMPAKSGCTWWVRIYFNLFLLKIDLLQFFNFRVYLDFQTSYPYRPELSSLIPVQLQICHIRNCWPKLKMMRSEREVWKFQLSLKMFKIQFSSFLTQQKTPHYFGLITMPWPI